MTQEGTHRLHTQYVAPWGLGGWEGLEGMGGGGFSVTGLTWLPAMVVTVLLSGFLTRVSSKI